MTTYCQMAPFYIAITTLILSASGKLAPGRGKLVTFWNLTAASCVSFPELGVTYAAKDGSCSSSSCSALPGGRQVLQDQHPELGFPAGRTSRTSRPLR